MPSFSHLAESDLSLSLASQAKMWEIMEGIYCKSLADINFQLHKTRYLQCLCEIIAQSEELCCYKPYSIVLLAVKVIDIQSSEQ